MNQTDLRVLAEYKHTKSYSRNKKTNDRCTEINPRKVTLDDHNAIICDDCKAILLRGLP